MNILYGQPAEHRNMPVEDAINLISNDFQEKLNKEKQKPSVPMAVPIISASSIVAPPLKDRHPEAIQTLLNLLADNLPLTVLQYDRIIKYLTERRTLQVKAELGDGADAPPPPIPSTLISETTTGITTTTTNTTTTPASSTVPQSKPPDPEIELQKKILNILNKSSITDTKPKLVYPDVQSLKNDAELIELLKDDRVQRALNSLMKTTLVTTIENHFKF